MNTEELDDKIARLGEHAQEWAELAIEDKIEMATRLMQGNYEVAERQVAAAVQAKKIPEGSPLVGEEWLAGPLITIRTLRATLRR